LSANFKEKNKIQYDSSSFTKVSVDWF